MDILGILTLAASISTAIWIYRRFQSTNYPLLVFEDMELYNQHQAGEVFWPRTRLRCHLKNTNRYTSAVDVSFSIYVAVPRRFLFFTWTWCTPYARNLSTDSISPLDSVFISTEGMDQSIEEFFVEKTDLILSQKEISRSTSKKTNGYYQVLRTKPLRLTILAKYRPGLQRTRRIRVSKRCDIKPYTSSTPQQNRSVDFAHLTSWGLRV